MKHIKKRFVKSAQMSLSSNEVINIKQSKPDQDETKNSKTIHIAEEELKNFDVFHLAEDGFMVQSFKYKERGVLKTIPEPSPITIHFSMAQLALAGLLGSREKLMIQSDGVVDINQVQETNHNFFGDAFILVTSLFNSLEAFINSQIPRDYTYTKGSKTYGKHQIQKNFQFEEKIKKVIPNITGNNFVSDHSHKYDVIKKLKKLRDNVAHTKEHDIEIPNFYEKLYTDLLDHDYLESLEVARDYINYYQEGLIEPCICGADY